MTGTDSAVPEPGRPVGRRVVLGMLGLGGVGVVFGGSISQALGTVTAPLTVADPTGLSTYLPGSDRFRIYSVVGFSPERTLAEYRLRVDGLVETKASYTHAQLTTELPQTVLTEDFQCVTGWRVDDVAWKGVRLSELLDRAAVTATATHVRLFSFDGVYTETLTLEQARRPDVLVAHHMLGAPVTREHGGPVRLYVAPMYGYKSLKWLDRIEVVEGLEPVGYWEDRGYDVDAWVGRSNGRDDEPTS